MTTAKIDAQLRQAMLAQPHAEFLLLLRVDQINAGREQVLEARGVSIRRSLALVPALAVTCTGSAGLGLLTLPWVQRVEADRPVYAL